MKKQLLLLAASLFAVKTISFSQELVVGGDMEDDSKWTTFSDPGAVDGEGNGDVPEAYFNYTSDYPTGGSGGCLEVTGYGITSFFVYQKVTIVPGNTYAFTGLVKNIGDVPTNAWLELNLTKIEPEAGAPGDSSWFNYSKNVWMGEPYKNFDSIDGDFFGTAQLLWKLGAPKNDGSGKYQDSVLTSSEITIPADETVTDWYVVIKIGCWNSAGQTEPAYDYLFDNISLKDITSGTSNIAQTNAENKMSIFPNPSNGIVNIKSAEGFDDIKYAIYNVSGAIVKSGYLGNKQNLDLSSFNKGVYILELDNNSSVEFHKLILE